SVPLGEAFHSRRLTIRSSQVRTVAPRPARRGYAGRMAVAVRLLAHPRVDPLITAEHPFEELPALMPRLASGALPALCVRPRYPAARRAPARGACRRAAPPRERRAARAVGAPALPGSRLTGAAAGPSLMGPPGPVLGSGGPRSPARVLPRPTPVNFPGPRHVWG